MIQVTPHMQVMVAIDPADFRCRIPGLGGAFRASIEIPRKRKGNTEFMGILYYVAFYGKREPQWLREDCRADSIRMNAKGRIFDADYSLGDWFSASICDASRFRGEGSEDASARCRHVASRLYPW